MLEDTWREVGRRWYLIYVLADTVVEAISPDPSSRE